MERKHSHSLVVGAIGGNLPAPSGVGAESVQAQEEAFPQGTSIQVLIERWTAKDGEGRPQPRPRCLTTERVYGDASGNFFISERSKGNRIRKVAKRHHHDCSGKWA